MQGAAFYLSGAALVIVGWTIVGVCVEAYGFWLLFCEFLPTVLQFSRRVPFMSKMLDMPFLKVVRCLTLHSCSNSKDCSKERRLLLGHLCLLWMSAIAKFGMHHNLCIRSCLNMLQLVGCPSVRGLIYVDCDWFGCAGDEQNYPDGRLANIDGGCERAQQMTAAAATLVQHWAIPAATQDLQAMHQRGHCVLSRHGGKTAAPAAAGSEQHIREGARCLHSMRFCP
jgi:hypothetical protein